MDQKEENKIRKIVARGLEAETKGAKNVQFRKVLEAVEASDMVRFDRQRATILNNVKHMLSRKKSLGFILRLLAKSGYGEEMEKRGIEIEESESDG